jgi:hypothetical protein
MSKVGTRLRTEYGNRRRLGLCRYLWKFARLRMGYCFTTLPASEMTLGLAPNEIV